MPKNVCIDDGDDGPSMMDIRSRYDSLKVSCRRVVSMPVQSLLTLLLLVPFYRLVVVLAAAAKDKRGMTTVVRMISLHTSCPSSPTTSHIRADRTRPFVVNLTLHECSGMAVRGTSHPKRLLHRTSGNGPCYCWTNIVKKRPCTGPMSSWHPSEMTFDT